MKCENELSFYSFWGAWIVDDESMGLPKRTRAWLGKVGGFRVVNAQKAVAAFNGASLWVCKCATLFVK